MANKYFMIETITKFSAIKAIEIIVINFSGKFCVMCKTPTDICIGVCIAFSAGN